MVLDKWKARASVDGLEIQKVAKGAHILPSRVASDSGTASSSSGLDSRKPEGHNDTSLSMEVDEDDVSLVNTVVDDGLA